jgi:hypothetical protein
LSVLESAQDLCHPAALALSSITEGSTAPKSGDAGKWLGAIAHICGGQLKSRRQNRPLREQARSHSVRVEYKFCERL